MAEKVNIGGKIPNSGISNEQFNRLSEMVAKAVSGNGKNSGGDSNTNITVNQTINNTNNIESADNPFAQLGWNFNRESWLGKNSVGIGNTEGAFKALADEISKLSASMQAMNQSAESFIKIYDIQRRLEESYNGDRVSDYIASVRAMNEVARDPQAAMKQITSAMADMDKRFKEMGGEHYVEHGGRGIVPTARQFKSTQAYAQGIINEAQEALKGGDIASAVQALAMAQRQVDTSQRALRQVARDIDRKERWQKEDAIRHGDQNYIDKRTNEERRAIEREKQSEAKSSEAAEKRAQATEQKAAEAERRVAEAEQKAAAAEQRAANAEKRATEQKTAAVSGDGGTKPSQVSGGGGGGSDNNGPQKPRFFASVKELTDYLNNFDGNKLAAVSTRITKFLEDLDADGKSIRATFDENGFISGVGVTAISKKDGRSKVGSASYGLKRDVDQVTGEASWTIDGGKTRTNSDVAAMQKAQDKFNHEYQRVLEEFTALMAHPTMLFGDEKSNSLLGRIRNAVEFDANGKAIGLKGDNNLVTDKSKLSMADLEAADKVIASLESDIKALNKQMPKTFASSAIEQMKRNVSKFDTEIAKMPTQFNNIGVYNTDERLGAYTQARTRYEQANNAQDAVAAYSDMFHAREELVRSLDRETAAYRENKRAREESEEVERRSTVDLKKYADQYGELRRNPKQLKAAREAAEQYRNAQTREEKDKALNSFNRNMTWMKRDLSVAYPEYKKQKREQENAEKQNKRQSNEMSRQYRDINSQQKTLQNVRKELAEMAAPYGGLESGDLPKYLKDVVKQVKALEREGNPNRRKNILSSIGVGMGNARMQNNKGVADRLIAEMQSKGLDTTALAQARSVVDVAQGPEATATAYQHLAEAIGTATKALNEYDKAEKSRASQQAKTDKQIKDFQKQVDTIQLAYSKMGKTVDTSDFDKALGALQGTDVTDKKALGIAQTKVREEIADLRKQQSFETRRTGVVNNLDSWLGGLTDNSNALAKVQELRSALEELRNVVINSGTDFGKLNEQLANISTLSDAAKEQAAAIERYEKVTTNSNYGLLGNEHGATREDSAQLKKGLDAAFANFKADQSEANLKALVAALEQVEEILPNISKIDAFGKLNEQVDMAIQRMDLFKSKYGDPSTWKSGQRQVYEGWEASVGAYNAQVQAGNLDGAKTAAEGLNNQIKALNESFESGGGLVGVYDGKITSLIGKMFGLYSAFSVVQKGRQLLSKMVTYVTNIDTAMTELKKVTDETAASYTRFQKESGKTAVEIGSSITDLINTSVEYGRMGYSLAESQQLGVTTTKFANTGNFNNVTEASDALIAIIRGFDGLEVSDAAAIGDKLTAVANAYAVTASDIAAGLQRSASALNLGGTNVDQATAMITAITEVTRDAGSAGNAIKTLSMRIRGAKTELEAAGEDTSMMAESTSKLRAQVAALTNVDGSGGFDIMQDEDTFKSVYDIMLGISRVWDDMTDVKQSALLELLAGKVRSNQVAALLNNMSRAEEILKTSQEATGTMDEVHARWLDSIVAKQAQLTASWENLSQTVVNSDMVKMFYDSGSGILNTLDSIIGKIGALGPVLSTVGTALFAKTGGGNALSGITSFFDFNGKKQGTVNGKIIKEYNDAYKTGLDKEHAMAVAVSAAGEQMNGATEFAIKYSKGLVNVGEGATVAEMKISALGAVLKNVGINLAVTAALTAVGAGLKWAADEWDKYANAEQHATQAADDAAARYKEAQDSVTSLENELASLQKQYDELKNKGSLSFVDEQTKSDLAQATAELNAQLELEKKIALERKRESHDANKNAWKSTYYPNTSLSARLKNSDVYTDATKLLDFNEVLAGAKEGYDYELSVVSDAADYIERGFYKSDVEGAIKLFQHLKNVQIEYNEIAAQTNEEWLRTDYADLAKDADNLAQKLEGGLLTTYRDLTSALKEMREYGETDTKEYKDYLAMRNAIGKDIEPVLHQQQLLAELREDDGFNETYQALENLAKQSEITADTLNQQEYDAFGAAFVAAGGDVKYLIDRLNELRVAAENAKVSETVASDIKTQVESLLGNKSTGASIFKNTGFGTAALTEDDYKKIADMNDRELLKAVENSHGTVFFNQQAFNDVIDKRLTEHYNKMYDDMLLKQAEYVKESKSLEEDLLKYQLKEREAQSQARDEELKALREKIDASAKNLNTIQDEINMYNRLAEQIRQSQTAFGRWQTAHGAPEEGDNYDKALEAYQDLLNGFKSGRVGNASYRAAEEYLLGSNGDFYNNKAQRDLLKRYLTKGKNDRGEGARNFQQDAIKKGILNSDGTVNDRYSYIEDIASAMGIGVDLAEHMFGEMNEFIADANKKYKVNRRPLEESARSTQYADYIDRRAAYQDALANYKQNNGDQASLKVLMEAYNAYVKAAGDVGIGEESLRNQEIVNSNDELAGAIGKQTGATEEATAAMSDLTTALNDKKEEEAKKAEEEAKRKAEEEAKRKADIEEQKAAFTQDVNDLATKNKINKQASYKDGIWTVTDNETGTATNYNDASALLIGMFGTYASGIQDDIANLTAAALQVTSNMEQGAAKFGEKALASFNIELEKQGKDPLGIAPNGKFVVNGEEYDAFFDALGAILGEKFDTPENTASGVKLINTMLKSVGKEGYTATYADGMYNVNDAKTGKLIAQYITAQDALWDLGKGPISDFAVTVREVNETIKTAGSELEAKVEEGKTVITDLATGKSQEVESLAAGLQAKLQEKISAAQLSFGEFAGSVASLAANYQINSIATSGAFASLSKVINDGADKTATAIQALNNALDLAGIEEKIGLTADGRWTFGDKIFDTFDKLIEAAFGQIQLDSPVDGAQIVQNILDSLGEESFIEFNQDTKKYDLFDKDNKFIDSFDTYTEAITAITSGSASELAQLIGQINQAYSKANTNLQAIIEDGEIKITNLRTKATETLTLTDQNIAKLAQSALGKLEAASAALNNVEDITVTVTANGSIQLTSRDGSPLFEFGDLSSLIQAAVASGISKALAEKNGSGEDNNAGDNTPPEPEKPATPATPPHGGGGGSHAPQTNLPSDLIGTVVDIVEANQGVIDAATIARLKQIYNFDAVREHAGNDRLIANAGNDRLSDDAIAHFLYSLIDNHPELNEQFLNKEKPEEEKPAETAPETTERELLDTVADIKDDVGTITETDKQGAEEQAEATAETIQSIFAGRDWWDVPDSDIEKIKQLYDFDLAREQHPNFAAMSDRELAFGLNQLGEGAEQYRRELSEEPAEVPVEADTTKAQSSINALGAMDQTVTVTANVVYNDPGFTPNVSGGGGADVSQTAATGTTNAAPGTSLVDEQGAELIEHVNRGTFELGTDNGPRLTQLDRGDIVHTAEETKKIKRRGLFGRMFDAFRNGGVKRGGAFAKGYDPKMMIVDELKIKQSADPTVSRGALLNLPGGDGGGGGGGKSKKNYIKDALKWAEKLVDWIPTALDILKKKTQDYIKAAEKAVGYLSRNSELDSAIENTRAEIDLNTKAVNRYKKQANDFAKRARLSSDIVKLIHEGTIDIRQYDEDTRKAIQTYQTWWDKAKGCLDTIESLNDQLYDLSKQKLDNIVDYYSNINDLLEEQIKTYNGMVEVKEAYGQEMTRDDYLDAIKLTTDVIKNLSEEYDSLDQELTDQVNSGIIKVGSDDWYNYAKQLETLKSTIDEAKVSLSELNDNVANIALNNLQTSIYYLDDLQNKIEGLQKLRSAQGSTEEVNSYRSLISNGMKQIENLQQQNAELEKQLDGLDVLSEKYQEVYKQIQDNKDEIMDIKASQEQWNDAILDLKIDLLQKQNEKYQQRLDIMNALNDLEDARQRRVLMYNNETGFGYVQDEDAVEKAQDAVNDQIYNLVISGLEEQKSNNNIYDNMGNQLIPVQDMLSSVDFTRYYDSINRGSENSTLLTNILKNIDLPELLEGTKGGDVSIDIGDIILNGVNDAEALGDAIIAQLPGYLVQAIYAKGG